MLLVVPDSDIDAFPLQLRGNAFHVGFPIVIREQHPGAYHFGGMYQLLRGHRVGLVAGQEGDVDVLDGLHLGDVLGVAGDVDAQAVEGEDVAVVAPLGMELQMPFGGVVGRDSLHGDVVGQFQTVAVVHRRALAEHLYTTPVHDQLRALFAELPDGRLVVVVEVLVGDEDDVGLGQGGVVNCAVAQFRARVNFNLPPVIFDADAGVHQGVDSDGFPALGGELVRFVVRLLPAGRKQPDRGQYADEKFFHNRILK